MTWVKTLLKEYAAGKRGLEAYRRTITAGKQPWELTEAEADELVVVGGMISDLQFAINWMRSGRRPDSGRRGIDIKDAYSRSILMDMDLLPNVPPEQELRATEQQKKDMARILMKFSARERQCYLLHMAQGMSYAEISKEMRITKASVQDYVERAKNKIPAAQ